jgi:hypothetical protein
VRKALLVLALIAASFAGGAAVNGPGLAWLRDAVGLTPPRIEPGLSADDPNADFDLDPAPKRTARARPSTPRRPSASASAPASATASPMADAEPSQSVTPNNERPTPEPPPTAPPSSPPPAAADPLPTSAPLDNPAPPPLEPPASAAARAPEPGPANPSDRPAEPARGDRDLARAAGSESAPGPPSEPRSWADLAGKLKAAGVDRFWVEGTPGGPVRFRCVVPLVGRGAVGQQFEAEADDIHAAAELALRRVVLWRAAQER